MTPRRRLAALLLGSLLLAACGPRVTSVPLRAADGPSAAAGAPRMTVTERGDSVQATAFVAGQYFAGPVLRESREVWVPVRDVDTYRDSQGNKRQRVVYYQERRTVYGPRAEALLTSGTSGDTLACDFRLAAPAWGFGGGGIAECLASDGTRVAASF